MNTRKLLGILSVALIMMLLLLTFGCSSPASTPSATQPAATTQTSAPTSAASGKVYKLTFALFQPPTALLSQINTDYANEIQKRTSGQVQVTVYQGGSLLGAPDMFQGVKNGLADMGNCTTIYNPGNFPFSRIAELPAKYNDEWVVSNAMNDFLAKYQTKEWSDVHVLMGYGPAAINGIYMAKTPINTLEDWKGKAIRTNSPEYVKALGGTVKDVAMASVYDSLSKGVLDGVTGSPEMLKTWKLADVAKYMTLTGGGFMPGTIWYNIMNKSKWDSLPPDIQKVITDVSNEYSGKLGLGWDQAAIDGLNLAKTDGDQISVISSDEMNLWQQAIGPITDSYLQSVVAKGYSQQEVNDAWNYFQNRVDYWNGQLAANNITPILDQVNSILNSK